MAKKLKKLSDFVGDKDNPSGQIEKIFNEALLSPEEEIPKPEVVFGVTDSMNGSIYVGTKGNISMLKGQKKSRKTFVTSAIAACVAGDKEIIQFKSHLPKKGLVLYVDTEQGRYDCKKVLNRTLNMTGMDVKDFSIHLKFLTLRPFSPKTRKEVIEYAIKKFNSKLDLVIIDGIRDLITDINDPNESTEILTNLMSWSSDHNIHIMNVLHENKSNQNARGHLGTELDNKAESIIRVVKVENNKDYSAIEAESMRGLSFDPYVFTINNNGYPELSDDVKIDLESDKQPKQLAKEKIGYDTFDDEMHTAMIQLCYTNEQGMFEDVNSISAREFTRRLKESFLNNKHKLSDAKLRDFTNKYLENGKLKDINEDEGSNVKKLVPGFDFDLPF